MMCMGVLYVWLCQEVDLVMYKMLAFLFVLTYTTILQTLCEMPFHKQRVSQDFTCLRHVWSPEVL